MAIGVKRYLGVGVEGTFGTAVSAQTFLDFTRSEIDVPDAPQVVYPGAGGGRLPMLTVPGPYVPGGTVTVGVDPEQIGYLLIPFFGSYDAQGSDPYTHTWETVDVETLTSATIRIGKGGVFEHRFEGATGTRLVLEAGVGAANVFLMATAEFLAEQDTLGSINSNTKSFPTSLFTIHEGAVLIGGGAGDNISASLEHIRVELNNNLDREAGVRFGSRFAAEFPVGAIDVSGTMRLKFGSSDEYERFWGDSGGPVAAGNSPTDITATFTKGSDTFAIRVPDALWTRVAAPTDGRNRITQEVSFIGLLDATQETSFRIVALNTTAEYAAA
jgi:hypothetical protein